MNIRSFLLAIALSVICLNRLYSQPTYPTTLDVKVVDSEEKDSLGSFFYPYKLKVAQEFYIQSTDSDTLRLHLRNTGIFQSIRGEGDEFFALIPDMKIRKRDADAVYREVDFQFDGINITIPEGEGHIEVEYGYYSDLCFRTKIKPCACGLMQFNPEWNSCYFTDYDNRTELVGVSFDIPDAIPFFVNCPYVKTREGKIVLELDKKQGEFLSFHLVDPKWFEIHNIKAESIDIDLFLSRRDINTIGDDMVSYPVANLDETYVGSRKEYVANMLTALNSLFPNNGITKITILEDYLKSYDENYGYGLSFQQSDSCFTAFVDYSFWDTQHLAHELVHGFLKHNKYENTDAHFFFDESLIEYLANYIFYRDSVARGKAFADKQEYYLSLPAEESVSILDIERNYVITETGSGTWSVIYYKVPFLIHQLACKLGEEKFLEILSSFYADADNSGRCLFDDLGRKLIESGLSETDWNEFRDSV